MNISTSLPRQTPLFAISLARSLSSKAVKSFSEGRTAEAKTLFKRAESLIFQQTRNFHHLTRKERKALSRAQDDIFDAEGIINYYFDGASMLGLKKLALYGRMKGLW